MRAVTTAAGRWTGAYYVAMFAALGVHLPFWPVWLAERGIPPEQVAAWLGVAMIVRIPAGLFLPILAEWANARRLVLGLIGAASAMAFWAHDWAGSPAALFALTILTGCLIAGMMPLSEALGTAAARTHGFAYAHARGIGSLGFLLVTLAAGMVFQQYGIELALIWMVISMGLTVPIALRHPGGGKVRRSMRIRRADIMTLSRNRVFLIAAICYASLMGSHGVLYALGSLHWRTLGLDDGLIGGLWAFGVGVEIVLMIALGPWLMRRMGIVGVFALGGIAGLIRWGAMCFDPPVWLLWPLQGGHALTFAAAHLAMMAFVQDAVPGKLGATAQGLASAMIGGALMALCTFGAGWLYPEFGGGAYAVAAFMSLLGLGFLVMLHRQWDRQPLPIT